jgi:glycosyltransferase involved in cell wall biosynthesis
VRIVQVTLRFDAPGGVETNVREVAKRLKASGEDVQVFASDLYDEDRWERRTGYAPVVDGVPVTRFPVMKRAIPGLNLPMWPGLVTALSESGADVIHAHSHRYGHVLQAAAVARRRGIPLVVSTHYHPADRGERPLKRGLLRVQDHFFGMTAYRTARALVVETELEARLVRQFAPSKSVRVIPPGVDLGEWATPAGDIPPPGLPGRYLLYAGRIASNKGLPTLVRALSRLPPGDRPYLVLLGRDWGERPGLEALSTSLGVADRIRFLGHLDDRGAYRAVFRRAQGFLLPSEWEAFGLVLLEAMAAGIPIAASRAGGVPEVVGTDSGLLVDYGDDAGWADAMRILSTDDARRRSWVEAGRRRVAGLTWDRCAERHRELYRELASARTLALGP